MFGRPAGELFSVFMKVGKLLSRFVCDSRIDDELSTMNSRSRFRLTVCWNVFPKVDSGVSVGFSRLRAVQAHKAGATAASAAQRSTRISERPVMGSSSRTGANRMRRAGPDGRAALKLRDYRESVSRLQSWPVCGAFFDA